MARNERDNGATRGRGATPKKGAKAKRLTPKLSFDLSKLAALKEVHWTPFISVILVVAIMTPIAVYWDEMVENMDQEIVSIEVRGNLKYLNAEMLKTQLDRHLGEGFFALDLHALRDEVEAMPWVYSTALQRQWPGTLRVHIKEQYPVAVWNEEYYLNQFGEMFRPDSVSKNEGFPVLKGPEEKAKDILQRYVNFKDQLAVEKIDLEALKLEPRGAWRVTLKDNVVLKLGRDPIDEKMSRFIKVYKQGLSSKYEDIKSIDARYTNGIAVRWKEKQSEETGKSGTI